MKFAFPYQSDTGANFLILKSTGDKVGIQKVIKCKSVEWVAINICSDR